MDNTRLTQPVVDKYIGDKVIKEVGLRDRVVARNMISVKMDTTPLESTPGHALEFYASTILGRLDMWRVIADINPLRHPAEWTVDDIINIPIEISVV